MDHRTILAAYMARLTDADIEAIQKASHAWTVAALNYGNSAQDKARAGFYAMVCNAVENLADYDKRQIEQIVNSAI
jgi:hypothetical protein